MKEILKIKSKIFYGLRGIGNNYTKLKCPVFITPSDLKLKNDVEKFIYVDSNNKENTIRSIYEYVKRKVVVIDNKNWQFPYETLHKLHGNIIDLNNLFVSIVKIFIPNIRIFTGVGVTKNNIRTSCSIVLDSENIVEEIYYFTDLIQIENLEYIFDNRMCYEILEVKK